MEPRRIEIKTIANEYRCARHGEAAAGVAQVSKPARLENSDALEIFALSRFENRRYGRLETCATMHPCFFVFIRG
jgi:hypothetical protein